MDVLQIDSDLDVFSGIELRDDLLADLERRLLDTDVDLSNALRTITSSADEYQKQVISASGSRVRMVAPAGSGKTQT